MMIGPAPMMRIDSMSVRLGIGSARALFHHLREPIEEIAEVVRARARLGMALEAERGFVGERKALKRAVEERDVRDPSVGRQRRRIDREAVVLAGDQHLAGVLVEHGMVRTVMAELHLERPASDGEPEQLMAQTDAEGRQAGREELA